MGISQSKAQNGDDVNPITNRLESVPESISPEELKRRGWREFNVGQVVKVEGFDFRILSVDVAKQQIKLKVVPKD